uniref:Uncharacterized protein n=1 Tax=Heterorhabditis bacteriophora TaxID=37862 RepID=A0A1I7WNR1_HETBA
MRRKSIKLIRKITTRTVSSCCLVSMLDTYKLSI